MSLERDLATMSARERGAQMAYVLHELNQTQLALNLLLNYLIDKGIVDKDNFDAWAKKTVEEMQAVQSVVEASIS